MTVDFGDKDMPNKMMTKNGLGEYDLHYRAPGIRIGSSLIDNDGPSEMILEIDLFLDENSNLIEELRSLLSRLEIAMGLGFCITLQQGFGLTCSKRLGIYELIEEVQQVKSKFLSSEVMEK